MSLFRPRFKYFLIFLGIMASIWSIFHFSNKIVNAQTTAQTGVQTASPTLLAQADTSKIEELKKKIEEQSKNIEALNKEIETYSALKDKTTKEAQTLQGLIKELDTNAKVLDLDIKKTRSQISRADLEINKLDNDIETSEEKIASFREVIREGLRQMEYTENTNLISSILSKRNLSEVLVEVSNRVNLNDQIRNEVSNLRQEKENLEVSKVDKEKKKDELSDFQAELSDKKKVVEYNKNEKNKVLATTKNQEENYQKILKEKQAAKAAFEKDLFEYESSLKFTLDPSSIPKAGTSPLSWPLDNIKITQLFGKTVGASKLYVSGSHNGVDFGASIGTPVKAAAMGVVAGAGDTDLTCPRASFGRWVLIKHTNGLATIYAHLSVISVKEGDAVTTGQVIGYSGNTGYSTGPHLHISVYAANAVNVENRPSVSCGGKVYRMPIAPIDGYLDPMLYLPKP